MKRLLACLAVVIALAQPASAQGAEIEAVIDSQIEAFLADDFVRAFDHASPAIQSMFRTPENFGMMVRQGYPMVHRPAEVRHLGLSDAGGRIVQTVQVTDGQGAVHVLEYEMIRTGSGWKINGVRLVEAPGVAA